MGTTAEKLQKILDSKEAIKVAISAKGGSITDTTPFSEYATQVENLPSDGNSQGWSPNPTWWDIEKIVNEDDTECNNKMIFLFDDTEDTSEFSFIQKVPTSTPTQVVKVKTSDGCEYTESAFTHTWDRTKDKPCYVGGIEIYKTRYILVCFNGEYINNYLLEVPKDINYQIPHGKNLLWFNGKITIPTTFYFFKSHYSSTFKLESYPLIEMLNYEFEGDCKERFSYNKPLSNYKGTTNDFPEFSGDCTRIFYFCESLKALELNVNNVESMDSAFYGCKNLTNVVLKGDTSGVTNLYNAFSTNGYLRKIQGLNNFKNVIKMNQAFSHCNLLKTSFVLDVDKCQDLSSCFGACFSIKKITVNRDGSTRCSVSSMFNNCLGLIEVLGNFSLKNVSSVSNIFNRCISLTTLNIKDIGISLQIGSGTTWGHLLTVDSLLNTIKELIDTGSSLTLTMGSANLEKLASTYVRLTNEAEVDETMPKLPFEVCESTDEGAMLITDYVKLKNWTLV